MRAQGSARARILLLDEDPTVARLVRASLPEPQYRVLWASDAGRACDFLLDEPPHLALVGTHLPRANGWEFLEYLRGMPRGRFPVVMMADSSEPAERRRTFEAGASRILFKPLQPRQVQRAVSEILRAREQSWIPTLTAPGSRWNELLFDPTTELASLALVFGEYRDLMARGSRVHVFCIEIEPVARLAEREGWDAFDLVRREFVRGLQIVVSAVLGSDVIIATSHPGSSDFYCFVRDLPDVPLDRMVRSLEEEAKLLLQAIRVEPFLPEDISVSAGAAVAWGDGGSPARLYNAVREAKALAGRRESRLLRSLGTMLEGAIRSASVRTHFQPIFDLRTRRIMGYEALSRGPAGTEIESPDVLFDLARDFQLVWDLQSLCVRNVEPFLEEICGDSILFFNLEASFIQQMHERGTAVLEPFLACGDRVVLEVTERGAIRDYATFRQALHQLKSMGFQIAIDDCGSGYATLEAVAELKPDFLKVGHSLFTGLERDPVRRRIVELVARCGETIGARTVAEAIETEDQLAVCLELEIGLGQGYLLAPPAPWTSLASIR